MQKITPCLWFDHQAEEAARFYCSVFPNARLGRTMYYGPGAPQPEGTVMTVGFEIDGQAFLALNAGPHFTVTPSISLVVDCQTQEEVDTLWRRLAEGGRTDRCGWLQDRFGQSWQVVPRQLIALVHDEDPRKAQAVMRAMLDMDKVDIAALQLAHDLA